MTDMAREEEEGFERDRSGIHDSLSLGFLASAPLFLVYEIGLASGGEHLGRNAAELVLGRGLVLLGRHESLARWLLLLALFALAFVRVHRRGLDWRHGLLRLPVEGLFAAFVLGPLLVVLLPLFGVTAEDLGVPTGPTGAAPSLAVASRLVGAAAWEELVFRVGCYGVIVLFTVQLLKGEGLGWWLRFRGTEVPPPCWKLMESSVSRSWSAMRAKSETTM